MRDPRLAEIDFLMDLETNASISVRSTGADETTGAVRRDARIRYGLDPGRFRDMVLDLLLRGFIGGPAAQGQRDSFREIFIERERSELIERLVIGQTINLNINHAGRIHLWSLRDSLLRDPDVEPLGLLSKAAWSRALDLRLRWATATTPLSIIFLDLDDFGKVNKELGHGVGDAVLVAAFGLIKNLVGARGAAYRCGGEEVGILLPDLAHEVAVELAEELRQVVASDVRAQVPALNRDQTASLGVSTFDAPVANDEAVQRVDMLMRAAKKAGKNRVHSE